MGAPAVAEMTPIGRRVWLLIGGRGVALSVPYQGAPEWVCEWLVISVLWRVLVVSVFGGSSLDSQLDPAFGTGVENRRVRLICDHLPRNGMVTAAKSPEMTMSHRYRRWGRSRRGWVFGCSRG